MSSLHRFSLTLPALFIAALSTASAQAQPAQPKDTKLGDEMIFKYLCAETDRLSKNFAGGARTAEQWQQVQPKLHREFLDMLGLWPLPEKTPLKATVTGRLEAHGVIVEKLHYQSKPGLYVTANLYRPKDAKNDKSLPAIVYVCGHANKGRDGNKSAYQDHGFWFANNGYVCLILDTLQLGEIPGIHHGTYGLRETKPIETRFWWHSAGYTPAGVECWNGVRGIDYLLTRPEVDPEKIGVTGISDGGAATFWIAAADERVKVAVPVSGMSDLECYVKNKIVNGHCDCMFMYNTYQWEWSTIAALIAPRPLLFANSDNDHIFPMDGNRRIIARLRDHYKMLGKPDLVDEYVSVGGHAYRPDLRVAAFKFINRHLKGDAKTPVKDADYAAVPGKDLRVFPTDEDLPKDVLNGKIDQTFVPRAVVKLPERGKFEEWQKGMIAKVKEQSFRNIDTTLPATLVFGKAVTALLETSAGRQVGLFALGNEHGLLLVDDIPNQNDFGKFTFAILPFSMGGSLSWTKKSPPNYVERSHALFGTTVDAEGVRDVVSSLRYRLKGQEGTKISLTGSGKNGILAAYAALFEPSIKEVVVINPPKSHMEAHMEGPHFLGVLRVLDIPEALGLLAPRPLTIIGGNDPAFDRTAEIYRLAGAADKLVRK